MVIPYAAGGTSDIVGRFVGTKLSEELWQQLIADNRGGAGSTVGTDIVAKAPADGYTLLVTNSGLAYNASLYSKLPYDTLKGLAAVSLIGVTPNVLVVHPSVPGHIKGNRLRALAVSGAKRSPALPDLPTIAEGGVAGYDYTTWYGMLVPAATSKTIIAKLNHSAVKALGNADMRDKLAQQGLEAESSTPEHFAAMVKQDVARWGKIIKAAGIQAE